MAPKLLYYIPRSSPVRAVLMTADALGVELDLELVDLLKKEQRKPEFVKMNPQHTVPTLDDDGYYLSDSHAITAYLVGKYGKDDSLYPKDLKKRGTVDQRLHFDSGVLFPRLLSIGKPLLQSAEKKISEENAKSIAEMYGFLNAFLEGKEWIAGDNMTIADIHIVAMMTIGNVMVSINAEQFPNLSEWYKKATALPMYEKTRSGAEYIETLLKTK